MRPQLSCSVEVEGLLVWLDRIPFAFQAANLSDRFHRRQKDSWHVYPHYLGRQAGIERLWSLPVEIDSVQPPNLSISKTVDEVIVHHADRLHVRINNGRTHERESAAFEILAKRVRLT